MLRLRLRSVSVPHRHWAWGLAATAWSTARSWTYAYGIGLVFQIVDDVLDVVGSQEQLGKPIGSDSENGKTTFVTLFGTDGAMELAKKLNNETCASLHREFGEKSAFLVELARELLVRRS